MPKGVAPFYASPEDEGFDDNTVVQWIKSVAFWDDEKVRAHAVNNILGDEVRNWYPNFIVAFIKVLRKRDMDDLADQVVVKAAAAKMDMDDD